MNVLFYGTPAFALPTLEALLREHQVVAVVTQPDRPAHRGHRLTASPVKERALAAGVAVLQPARVREAGWAERLRALGADVAVVVAFGQILPRAVLDAAARGSINVHASLLPKYRGAAPIAWAIMRGETETGVSIMQMDEGMDTGPVLAVARVAIEPEETAGELGDRLADLGARTLIEALGRLDAITPTPQEHAAATLARRLTKADGRLDWRRPAPELVNVIRGCNPWPGAHTKTPRGVVGILRARAVPTAAAAPGTLVSVENGLAIATGDGAMIPLEVQPENRHIIGWQEYLRGARLKSGDVLAVP